MTFQLAPFQAGELPGGWRTEGHIFTLKPVGFPGNLPPHRCLLTSHTSLKEEEEEGRGPTDPGTLPPSLGPLATPLLGVWEQQAGCPQQRCGELASQNWGVRDFRVSGAGSWGARGGSGTWSVLG